MSALALFYDDPPDEEAEVERLWAERFKLARKRERSAMLRRAVAIRREVAMMNEELDALADFVRLVALVQQRIDAIGSRQWDLIEELCDLEQRLEPNQRNPP